MRQSIAANAVLEPVRLINSQFLKYLKIVQAFRFFNTRSMILFYLLALKLAGLPLFTLQTLLMVMVFFSLYGYLSLTNYLFDREVDKINSGKNPLNSGQLSVKLSVILSIGFACFALALAVIAGSFVNVLFVLAVVVIGYFYSCQPWRWSCYPIRKFLMMLTVYTVLPFLNVIFRADTTEASLLLLISLAVFYGSFMLFSDVKDIKGDKKEGKRTLAVELGVEGLSLLSLTLSSAAFVGIAAALILRGAYPLLPLLMLLILIFLQQVVYKKPQLLQQARVRHIGGYLLLGTLLAFIALL